MTLAVSIEAETEAGSRVDPASALINDVLGDILTGGIDIHRCQAARALGKIVGAKSVAYLTKALLDEDADVRTDAAGALVALADEDAGKQLLENLLGDPCAEVKMSAIDALARLQNQEVIPWLRRIVGGRDEEIAWDEDEFYATGWDDWADIQSRAVAALGRLGAIDAVPDIVAALDGEDAQDLTEVAFAALGSLGPVGIRALGAFLSARTSRTRRRAATALGKVAGDEASEMLARALGDSAPDVRLAALAARAEQQADDPKLMLLLDDPEPGVRAMAARLLGANYPDELGSLLGDPDEAVQIAVLSVLAKGDEAPENSALVNALSVLISEAPANISVAASAAISAVAPEFAGDFLSTVALNTDTTKEVRLAALKALEKTGFADFGKTLIRLIDDDQRQVRLEVMAMLARISATQESWPNDAGTSLLGALAGVYEPEPETVEEELSQEGEAETNDTENTEGGKEEPIDAAATDAPTSTLDAILTDAPGISEVVGLPDQGVELTPEDVERLAIARNVLRKKRMPIEPVVVLHEDIRRFAARVLGDVENEDVAEALSEALASEDKEFSAAAADSLSRIALATGALSNIAADRAREAFSGAARDLKLPLIRALSVSEQSDIVEFLESQLSDEDSFVCTEAIRALGRKNHVGSIVRANLADPDPAVRLTTAQAIAGAAKPGAVEQLVTFAISNEGYHGREAAVLLRGIDSEGANNAFVKILRDPDQKRVWSVAIEALEEINQT